MEDSREGGVPRYTRAQELANIMAARGIRRVLYAGVHENFCILDRPFAIKQAVAWGLSAALLRDLTDVQYSPANPPYVSHAEGIEIMTSFIEKYWAPTLESYDIIFQ